MAAYAIVEIPNTFFPVFVLDIPLVVLVTAIAGIAPERAGMAGAAAAVPARSMVDREPVSLLECGWNPGRRVVAAGAIETE